MNMYPQSTYYHLEHLPGCELWVVSQYGEYIGQQFARIVNRSALRNVSDYALDILLNGPDDEEYNETWNEVLENAVIVDDKGNEWILFQDQDLFMHRR